MRVAIFSAKAFEKAFFLELNAAHQHELVYFEAHLNASTANLAQGFAAVSAFVTDTLDKKTIEALAAGGTKMLALRSAGYNHVDLETAKALKVKVLRVPAYSPHAIAEHTLALMLSLNRKIYKAYNRVRENNFSLEGLIGFDFYGKDVGIIGTGKIGELVCKMLLAFGCRVRAYDVRPNENCIKMGVCYVSLEEIFSNSDVISLHCPLTDETRHLVNEKSLKMARDGVMLINTGRGALIDTIAVIEALKSGRVGYLGLDVYEEEEGLFFEDYSGKIIHDDVFTRLLTFPNVLITGHQAFFTREAVRNIVETTLENVTAFEQRQNLENALF